MKYELSYEQLIHYLDIQILIFINKKKLKLLL